MKINDKGVADILLKMYAQLQEAESVRKDQIIPKTTTINISKCKANIETLMAVIEFEK